MDHECGYCRDWNRTSSPEDRRDSCGPCSVCQQPGHVRAHPRQPTSSCLCEKHWQELNSPGFRFELYHLIYLLVFGLIAIQIYSLVVRFWGR